MNAATLEQLDVLEGSQRMLCLTLIALVYRTWCFVVSTAFSPLGNDTRQVVPKVCLLIR